MDHVAAEQLGEPIHAVGVRAADVEHLARHVGTRSGHERVHHVGDKGEIARLRTVADDRQRLVVQLLREEDTEHGAVGARRARARAVHVEQPQRHNRHFVDVGPVQRVVLADVLRECVRILRLNRRGFGRRQDVGDAVAGAGGGIEESLHAGAARRFEDGDRAFDVGTVINERLLDGRHDVGQRGDVEHPLHAVEERRNAPRVADVDFLNREVRVRREMREVLQAAAAEIVEHGDATAVGEEPLDQMAADEAGAAGNENRARARCVGHAQRIRVSGTGTMNRPPAAMNAWLRFTIGSANRHGRITT